LETLTPPLNVPTQTMPLASSYTVQSEPLFSPDSSLASARLWWNTPVAKSRKSRPPFSVATQSPAPERAGKSA
jgi:hypothetical protein